MRAPLLCSLASALVVEVAIVQVKAYVPLLAQLTVGGLLGGLCYALLMRQYARPHFDKAWNLAGRLLRR
jgi:hypothetical protein